MFDNLAKIIFGRLSWESFPIHEPILLVTFAVVALGGKPELAVVDIDPSVVDEVRSKLPVLANARHF